MTEQQVFVSADEALGNVVAAITDQQWPMKLPEWFQTGRTQHNPSLRDIINYHAHDDAWVPDVLAGKTVAEVGDQYNGDLLGQLPKTAFAKYVQLATAAVHNVTNLDQIVHLSYGDYPVRDYLKHITYFRGLRVYDLSKVIGIEAKMPAELVQGLWDELKPEAEAWRKMGVFGPAVEITDSASLQDKLLALTGRDPNA